MKARDPLALRTAACRVPSCGWQREMVARWDACDQALGEHLVRDHTPREVADALCSAWAAKAVDAPVVAEGRRQCNGSRLFPPEGTVQRRLLDFIRESGGRASAADLKRIGNPGHLSLLKARGLLHRPARGFWGLAPPSIDFYNARRA